MAFSFWFLSMDIATVFFPFAMALFGLGMILSAVWAQRRWLRAT